MLGKWVQNFLPFLFLSAFMGALVYFGMATLTMAVVVVSVVFFSSVFALMAYKFFWRK